MDICLVAAGVRCAVLLDSRRAPRGSPPLADVLLALQQDQQQQQRSKRPAEDVGHNVSSDVACLGSLVLEGSLFLVNRALLLQRLNELPRDKFNAEVGCLPRGDRRERGSAGTAAVGSSPERRNGDCPAPPASREDAGDRRQRQGRRDFALVDVRKLLPMPRDRSDVLLPRLRAALRSAFGGVAADRPPPPCEVPFLVDRESTKAEATAGSKRESWSSGNGGEDSSHAAVPREQEGARWLRDWEVKEAVLDCASLRATLGDVGLPGLAGWLLEYPVIYCCPSPIGTNGGGGADKDEHVTGNCLAAVPLSVYSLSVELGNEGAGATGASALQAFSFSVPDVVSGSPEAEHHEGGVEVGLHGLVDGFLRKLESRIALHRRRSKSEGWHQPLVRALNVSNRTETLERVAL